LIGTIRVLCPGAAICAVTPTVGRAGEFVWPARHRGEVADEIFRLAEAMNVSLVNLAEIVAPWVADLPDGTHWHQPVHAAVAKALSDALVPKLEIRETRPLS
jgi:hypothetical protein